MNQPTMDISAVMDLAAAMEQMDGDAELLQEIVEIFLETGAEQLQAIEAAIAAGDVAQVGMVAHGMKGGASNFCAERFVTAARELEFLAKGGTLEGARVLLERMRAGLAELGEAAAGVDWTEVQRGWTG